MSDFTCDAVAFLRPGGPDRVPFRPCCAAALLHAARRPDASPPACPRLGVALPAADCAGPLSVALPAADCAGPLGVALPAADCAGPLVVSGPVIS